MAAEPNSDDNQGDPLEQTELARRLRRMEWPAAPVEVKERVLQRIICSSGDLGTSDGAGSSGPSAD